MDDCFFCNQAIELGERRHCTFVSDDGLMEVHFHRRCYEFARAEYHIKRAKTMAVGPIKTK